MKYILSRDSLLFSEGTPVTYASHLNIYWLAQQSEKQSWDFFYFYATNLWGARHNAPCPCTRSFFLVFDSELCLYRDILRFDLSFCGYSPLGLELLALRRSIYQNRMQAMPFSYF